MEELAKTLATILETMQTQQNTIISLQNQVSVLQEMVYEMNTQALQQAKNVTALAQVVNAQQDAKGNYITVTKN